VSIQIKLISYKGKIYTVTLQSKLMGLIEGLAYDKSCQCLNRNRMIPLINADSILFRDKNLQW